MNQDTLHTAQLVEIFSSFQGEGLYLGERMTFVRFGLCTLKCQFCDTPQGLCHQRTCKVEKPAGSENFAHLENPISIAHLNDTLSAFDDDTISITGGEPLEQSPFLEEWLPTLQNRKRIILETNGIHHERLDALMSYIDVVSMDIKLPSSTGRKPAWESHARFLNKAIASGKETYIKIVVTAKTSDRDIEDAIRLLAGSNRYIPTFIQPAASTLMFHDPATPERLQSIKRLCGAYLSDVRVQPQMHKEWGVL